MSGTGGGGQKPDLSQYNYGAISSLVLTADRSVLPRRDREPDGAPTTLVGRIKPGEMGSRVQRAQPKDVEKKKKKQREGGGTEEKLPAQGKKKRGGGVEVGGGYGYNDIIEATADVEGLTYRPLTAETREIYELILNAVWTALGDQAQDIVRSAADTILESLKNENMKDFDKKKEVEDVLGPVSGETFSNLLSLSKKITDYGGAGEDAGGDVLMKDGAEAGEGGIDDELGVAVVFDDEDEAESDDERYEVADGSDDDEEDEDDEGGSQAGSDAAAVDGDEDDTIQIGGATSTRTKTKSTKTDKTLIRPHEIDAFWVQRQISTVYPDPVTASQKATTVLEILSSEASLRDAENQLMELFDFQSFEVITKFLKNRDVVVWCTKLGRSSEDERVNVEVAMRERGVGWILKALAGERQAKVAGAEDDDMMDVDESDAKSPSKKPTTATKPTLAPTTAANTQPKKILDLESMAFSQGGHLMSNKKCKLPEGSFKRSRKGFEEIHVPFAKRPSGLPAGEKLVPVSELPEWARAAFTVPTLNRVQSKVYPVAFGTDENVLLCAPTSAGKVSCLFSLSNALPFY
jgi:pre-mRNA-splicing helicase BRR2